MTTFLAELSQREMTQRLGEALRVYVVAMGYPQGTEEQRAPMWLEHTRRAGWQAIAAFETDDNVDPASADGQKARMVGVAYGYRGATDQWWHQQVVLGLRESGAPAEQITRFMSRYFELTELHVDPRAQGHGLGEALIRQLLQHRDETHVLLSTPEIAGEGNRAWRLYRRLGFTDVIRQHQFAGDPRRFAVLGRPLPLVAELPDSGNEDRNPRFWHDEP